MKNKYNTTVPKSSLINSLLNSISPAEAEKIEKKMLIAAKIDDALKAKKWKKKDLLKALGKTNQSEITKWLSGTHNFTIDTLVDLEHVLEIRLLNLEEEQPANMIFHAIIKSPVSIHQDSYINDIIAGKDFFNIIKS